jgi:hypothetical protein
MGLQTGTVVHSCTFTVPTSVPLGSYQIVVIANGIASAGKSISVTVKRFKELKWEIKEKLELVENLKEIIDTRIKRVPDIDIKINEEIDFVRRFEEQWVKTVRDVAVNVDEAAAELSRTFISPEERPFVGIPEPVIEEVVPRKISAEEAHRFHEKIVFADGRVGRVVDKEVEEFHDKIHELYRSKGAEIVLGRTKRAKRKTAKRRNRK